MPLPQIASKEFLGSWVDIAVPGKKIAKNAFSGEITLERADLIGSADAHAVEEIGGGAFENCLSLHRVQARDDVKIGPYAFANCRSLSNAWFFDHQNGDTVGTIGEGAFQECRSLEYVNLRSKGIGQMAFQNCSALVKCEVDELEEIGDLAFDGCGSLRSVTMPRKVGQYAFRGCTSLTEVKVQEGPISAGTFAGCTALSSVTIPQAIQYIQEKAFFGCSALKSVQTSAGVIGESAFAGSGLESIKIGDYVQLRKHAFANCHRLRDVEGRIGLIGEMAFKECTSLQSITLPIHVDRYAFYGCRGLKEVVVPDQTRDIELGTFKKCTALASVEIPESVISIGESAFKNCEALESVRTNANFLFNSAFEECHALKSVILTYTETVYIGEGAFKGCCALENVVIAAEKVEIYTDAFKGCSSLKKLTLPYKHEFFGTPFKGSGLVELVIKGQNGAIYSESLRRTPKKPEKTGELPQLSWESGTKFLRPLSTKNAERMMAFLAAMNRNSNDPTKPQLPREMLQAVVDRMDRDPSFVFRKGTENIIDYGGAAQE